MRSVWNLVKPHLSVCWILAALVMGGLLALSLWFPRDRSALDRAGPAWSQTGKVSDNFKSHAEGSDEGPDKADAERLPLTGDHRLVVSEGGPDRTESMGWSGAPDREALVARFAAEASLAREMAMDKARELGRQARTELADGSVREWVGWEDGRPLVFTTHNREAAISHNIHITREAPYELRGSGGVIGVWDSGAVRASHREFGDRVVNIDDVAHIDHATHVAGIIAAAGVTSRAMGMAPELRLDAYDWNSDKSEMSGRGASFPGEGDKIYVSNHSYGLVAGWNRTGETSPAWEWYGSGTGSSATDPNFGRYGNAARDTDAIAHSLPYYLIFRSAGNDRTHNPLAGDSVDLTPFGSRRTIVDYDPASHPAGDGEYRLGFNTVSHDAVAKNIVTVGAVEDAVLSGQRNLANARMTNFSSWGPTDDGRIKPDLVANGWDLYSTLSSSDSAYGTRRGTSMSSPVAAAVAQVLVQDFKERFPGHAMRASTLRALLIHTADDLGTPGPNYQFGWGLVNAQAAADKIARYHEKPSTLAIIEDRIHADRLQREFPILWDGESPIRVTLVWTDPAGSATQAADSRVRRLVHDLDLSLIAPDESVHLPWVLPFTQSWDEADFDAAAVTGVNQTDNVEQVLLADPVAPGEYVVRVRLNGGLQSGASQHFSLIISGSAENGLPDPVVESVQPGTTAGGSVTVTVSGEGFRQGARMRWLFGGDSREISHIEVSGDRLRGRFQADDMPPGEWDLEITNPDGGQVVVMGALSVTSSLFHEDFESADTGWQSVSLQGSQSWQRSTEISRSPSHSQRISVPNAVTDTVLESPPIDIPEDLESLRIQFYHSHNLDSNRAGGVMEVSVGSGAWMDIQDPASGLVFSGGGYNTTIGGGGFFVNPLRGRAGWASNSGGFQQVVLDATDPGWFAGQQLRLRWRLGTRLQLFALQGQFWAVDDVILSAMLVMENLPPVIVDPASANPDPVSGVSTVLRVAADDDTGEAALIYTWSVNDDFDHPVGFSDNASNEASETTATFSRAGDYLFTVQVRDPEGLVAFSHVPVNVLATPESLSVSPVDVVAVPLETVIFVAEVRDQFGHVIEAPEYEVQWSVDGGGEIGPGGVFLAVEAGGPYLVTAEFSGLQAEAMVTIIDPFSGMLGTPEIRLVDGESLRLTWDANLPAGVYGIEWSDRLEAGSWELLQTFEWVPGENPGIELPLGAGGFFRIIFCPGCDWAIPTP